MDEARWLDPREERAWRSLMAMQDALTEFLERQLRTRNGLSGADYQVLAHLSEAGGSLRSFELGALVRWEKSRLSQHLVRMEKLGLVTRERCATDQRGCVAVITAEGTDRITAAAPRHVGDVRAALIDHLTVEEMETLARIGEGVTARLESSES